MTISSVVNRNDYVGNSATSVFPYTFRIFDETEILVTSSDLVGVETVLVLDTDYTVSGVGEGSGGNVTLVAGALTDDYKLTVRRVLPLTQTTDIRNAGDFFPEVHEDEFDRLVMQVQQLQDQLSRAIILPETEPGDDFDVQLPATQTRAGKILGFDDDGNIEMLTEIPDDLISVSAFIETLLDDASATVARATLGFTGAGGTVATAQIEDAAVTGAKLATTAADASTLEVAGGSMRMKDAGTTAAKLAASAVTARSLATSAMGFSLINGKLTATSAASALTIAIKTLAGADPSASDPVYVLLRSATAATSDFTVLTLTAATSLAVSSGSTLGTTNSTAFRIWVVGFNDAGTFRLGVINCTLSDGIYPLGQFPIASSTAEGGAGAADSVGVFYTGTAVTSKGYTVLGYFTYESGLATAGTWSADPTRGHLFQDGTPLPGDRIQSRRNATGAVATGTTTIPVDDTIPQNTEGTEFMSQAITPTSAANLLRVIVQANTSSSTTNKVIGAIFQDSTANALVANQFSRAAAADANTGHRIEHQQLAATTSATTFKFRAGPSSAATVSFNGEGGTRIYGGVCLSFIQVEEIMA